MKEIQFYINWFYIKNKKLIIPWTVQININFNFSVLYRDVCRDLYLYIVYY